MYVKDSEGEFEIKIIEGEGLWIHTKELEDSLTALVRIPGAPEQQIRILIAIMNEPGITQTDLSEQLNMTQAAVSRNCRALSIYLEKDKDGNHIRRGHNLIDMRPDLYNTKRLACWLTPKGQQLGADLQNMFRYDKTAGAGSRFRASSSSS